MEERNLLSLKFRSSGDQKKQAGSKNLIHARQNSEKRLFPATLFSVHLEQLANLAQLGAFQIGTVEGVSGHLGYFFPFSISCIGHRDGHLSTKNQHSSFLFVPGELFQKVRSTEKCIL